jgi:amino acid transporter
MTKTLTKTAGLGTFAVIMLITSAIDNIRNLPSTALFGSALIFFFIFSAIVFLIPAALVSAELSAICENKKNGIYQWVKLAFGDKTALLALWLQWINTMVWFPTILSFIAGTAVYLIDPSFAQNKFYLVATILSVFWLLTLINLKGIQVSAKFTTICTLLGMVIPMMLIIALAIFWLILGKPLQIHLTPHNLFPSFYHSENWVSLTAIMAAFLGMELAAVHIKNIANPQITFPKALAASVIFILITMILGALAIAFVLPANQINLVNGVMQAFTQFFDAYHLTWILPIITVMLVIGSLGSMISWIISPAKGLLQAAEDGYLPSFLCKKNKYEVASNLLFVQAVLVSVVCLAFLLMPSVNGSYWLLTDLSTQLYMLMYVLMFISAIVLKYKFQNKSRSFAIPFGKLGMWITAVFGLIGTLITLVVGFFPPEGINIGGILHYELVFTGGILGMLFPLVFILPRIKVSK